MRYRRRASQYGIESQYGLEQLKHARFIDRENRYLMWRTLSRVNSIFPPHVHKALSLPRQAFYFIVTLPQRTVAASCMKPFYKRKTKLVHNIYT